MELADPIRSADIAESIESALTGYDIVRGDPVNVVQGKLLIPFFYLRYEIYNIKDINTNN